MSPAKLGALATALRILSLDCVEHAGSGHPGMPMGMADIATVLWHRHLRHNPQNPAWVNRDRFVLSNGHGSALLYALLHLTGYDVPVEQLRRFRRLGSMAPGHPEFGCTPGVETTTGPLGQGLANAVGMAMAEKMLGEQFNTARHTLVDHHTYVFLGDGCLMEGISHESCSLAGTWQLRKLIAFWDDNGISIDGEVEGWFADDTAMRFKAYGWNVVEGVDGHDPVQIDEAIVRAKTSVDRPTLICCRTRIGHGSPNKAGTAECHGAPLGREETAAVRQALGWVHPPFHMPDELRGAWDASEAGRRHEGEWRRSFEAYAAHDPRRAGEFVRRMEGRLPADFQAVAGQLIASADGNARSVAARQSSQRAIEALAPALPELVGGSADLTGSNLTHWPGALPVHLHPGGNYIHYGVREFGMVAIANGLCLHGGLRPFVGTFAVFSDYARNGIRMAALMKLNVIFVLTHDSIGLGADGPTHQPVEHVASLRLMPNLDVWRPCDEVETAVAWTTALCHDGTPACLILSRQKLAHQARSTETRAHVARGGYVLRRETRGLEVILVATGSEVQLAVEAAGTLEASGIGVRVVSMPSPFTFDRQDAAYRDAVLVPGVKRVAVEAGVADYWRKYVGLDGGVVGLDQFGESGDAEALYEHFGITAQAVVDLVLTLLPRRASGAASTREARLAD